jgi:hypothetical protein
MTKTRHNNDLGPKAERARLFYENPTSGNNDDNDDSDGDASVNDFRRVQIIHKRSKTIIER